jgi:hypothetical protein
MLSAVNTVTTLPLVLNFLRRKPSSPTSAKNCLFPVGARQHGGIKRAPSASPDCDANHTLLSPKQTDEEYPCAVDCEQRSDGVELCREYLEHNQCKRELPDCCAHICAFKRSLRCANLDQFCAGEHH